MGCRARGACPTSLWSCPALNTCSRCVPSPLAISPQAGLGPNFSLVLWGLAHSRQLTHLCRLGSTGGVLYSEKALFSRPGVGFRSSRPRRTWEDTPFGSQQERCAAPQEPISSSHQWGSEPPRLSPPQVEPHRLSGLPAHSSGDEVQVGRTVERIPVGSIPGLLAGTRGIQTQGRRMESRSHTLGACLIAKVLPSVLPKEPFLLKQHIPPIRFVPGPMILQPGAPRIAGALKLGSPESSLSPRSDLSVPSNPTRSAQSLSSYNPFEDEDDTGSTVSEKEDIKAKTLVNKCFPLGPASLALSPFLCPGPRPLGTQSNA